MSQADIEENVLVVAVATPAETVEIQDTSSPIQILPVGTKVLEIIEILEQTILEIGVEGPQGPKGDPGNATQVIRTAAQALGGQRLAVSLADGTVDYADPSTLLGVTRKVYLTAGAAAAGDDIPLILYGPVEDSSWNWVPGEPLYAGVNGVLTQIQPSPLSAAYALEVGCAETATRIFFDPKMPIALAS